MNIQEDELNSIISNCLGDVKTIARKYFISGGNEDDLVQEGLIGLIDGVKSFDEKHGDTDSESFRSFILMCAKRQILDAIKKDNGKKNSALNNSISLNDGFEKNQESGVQRVSVQTPEEIVIDKLEQEETTKSIFIKLSESEKSVLELYLSGCKQSEIAVQLNKSTKSIDNTLQRIKNKIKGKG